MKNMSKLMISVAVTTLLFAGCNGENSSVKKQEVTPKPTISATSLSLRKAPLTTESEVKSQPVMYRTAPAGTAKRIKRAYQDAPPMIPHDVSDYLPITKNNNACLGCHSPSVAKSMGATPIPPTHYMNMRPGDKFVNGKYVPKLNSLDNQTEIKKTHKLYAGRYNCSQCHAPQATNKLAVKNTFQPDYVRKNGEYHSSWKDVMLDNLDTLGKDSNVNSKDIANKNSEAGHLKRKDSKLLGE